ncbi:kinase-like domain-containing protein [Rhizophagus clarus]|nr:kinase-like domain-containing protein [Rhizophagus clarus]
MSDNQFIFDNTYSLNINSHIIKHFNKINIKEINPTTNIINEYIFEGDLSILVDELVYHIFKEFNEGKNREIIKQHVLNYIHSHGIISQEICCWLSNNQNNSNSTYLFGYFNYHGIGTDLDKQKAIELYQKAAKLENRVAQLNLANMHIYGKEVDNDYDLAFELSKKLAEVECASGINNLGYCYNNGIGTDINNQKAFELFQKAADLGNSYGINSLGCCYEEGIGTDTNKQKAFELYKKAADLGNSTGMSNLGYCYYGGIGTDVDEQKAFELFQKAADLGSDAAQYNLAWIYENGDGIKDMKQAIYWYKKSAEQDYEIAQNKLKEILKK